MKEIRYISPICQEAPRGRICTKFATAVGVADVITSNNFFVIGQGVRILWGGVKNCPLPLTKPVAVGWRYREARDKK